MGRAIALLGLRNCFPRDRTSGDGDWDVEATPTDRWEVGDADASAAKGKGIGVGSRQWDRLPGSSFQRRQAGSLSHHRTSLDRVPIGESKIRLRPVRDAGFASQQGSVERLG
ncbi:hypothetical protein CKO51_20735 [Rhodopirellula sp. SM50]|nr:hypothetical protein CKO51_20735 [Rhodopirellula sp. SM50]